MRKFGHFLQSKEWGDYEKLEGHEVISQKNDNFDYLAVVKKTPFGKYIFVPYGPAVDDEEGLDMALGSLQSLAQRIGAIFVRVEPLIMIGTEKERFRLKKTQDIDPAHTWVIDLERSEDEILADAEKDRVRRWRKMAERGIKIRKTQDPEEIKVMAQLLNKLGKARQFTPQDEGHLKNQLKVGFATLFIAEFEGKPIAATLVHDYKDTRFVMHAAADDDYRKLRAGTSLTIETMIDAKRQGLKRFDFWGITTSEDPKHPWYGFTQYKKSFGGEQVDYAGTWDLIVKKGGYRMYEVARGVNRKMRRMRR